MLSSFLITNMVGIPRPPLSIGGGLYFDSCVCVRVCVCTSIHREGVICMDHARKQISDVMLKMLNSYADPLQRYFRMQNLTFQLAALWDEKVLKIRRLL